MECVVHLKTDFNIFMRSEILKNSNARKYYQPAPCLLVVRELHARSHILKTTNYPLRV